MDRQRKALDIIYEDGALLICRKPAGLAVQNASFGRQDLESMARTYRMEKTGKANPYLAVVHRLDQPVQGIVAFALTREAAASLSAQLQDGRMKKEYTALVCGVLPQKSGTLVHYLKKEPAGNRSRIVPEGTPGAKRAELLYEVLWERDGLTLVKILLKTGRHHQIRVQMAAVGAPIFGDGKYGAAQEAEDRSARGAAQEAEGCSARGAMKDADGRGSCGALQSADSRRPAEHPLALCASGLRLFHPESGKPLEFSAEPVDFPI